MQDADPVPEADAQEQRDAQMPDEAPSSSMDDKPEGDVIEQSQTVEDEQIRVRSPERDDVPEADWLEQSIVEPLDDDVR